jgi:hypothetical protein
MTLWQFEMAVFTLTRLDMQELWKNLVDFHRW